MTNNHSPDWEVTTKTEFDTVLEQLLTTALGNGVDPRGSWVYNTDKTDLGLETVIVELQKEETEA
jgi:hypothetical protein